MRLRSIIFLTAAGLVSCTSERAAPAPETANSALLLRERRDGYATAGRPRQVAMSAVAATTTTELPPITPADVVANMIIRTADASIQVDSLEPAVAQVRDLAARVGGYVANVGVQTGSNRLRSASLELKIPASRFDEALSGLRPIGKLESVNVSAADVGEEYVDVTARIENARRLERRLIELLASRTGKLKDVLEVEETLARVREEIERYEGRLRYLRTHIATSTLTVNVHEPVPVVGTAGTSVMGEAFRQAWRNFVTLLAVLVQSLGVIIPLGVLGVVAWIAMRRWRRVFSHPAA